jgi:hypothetical protein
MVWEIAARGVVPGKVRVASAITRENITTETNANRHQETGETATRPVSAFFTATS